jgi:hypothetical protein
LVVTYPSTILTFEKNIKMETEKNTEDYGICFLLAALCGIATAWVVSGSLLYMFIGALLGLLSAGFFVNVILRKGNTRL